MVALFESAQAIADATGKATAILQPMRAFEYWDVTGTTVQSTSTTLIPAARVYKGVETPSALIDGSVNGVLDTSDTPYTLLNGEQVRVVWDNCDVGARCTVTVRGERKK
jgi:hypothetical protein